MMNGAANDNAPQSAEPHASPAPAICPRHELGGINLAAVDLVFPIPALFGLADSLREIFRAPYPAGLDPIWCQQRQNAAGLEQIALFCKRSGIGADVAERFAQLGIAFADLQTGASDPAIFQKKKSDGGRPRDRFNTWSVKTTAMLGLECYIAGNFKPERAAARASKKFPNLARLSTRRARPNEKWKRGAGHDLARLLLSWRTAYREKTIPNAAEQSAFDCSLALLEKQLACRSLAERIAVGDAMLGSAARRARNLPL
jgi:hypothetical protein